MKLQTVPVDTPEFLAWSLEYACPVRGLESGCDPELTWRQLRAARAVSDARREGRMFEGLCVDPPHGFRVDEALAIYGGLAAVERSCRSCPANALVRTDPACLAGCYGLVPLPVNERVVHAAIDAAIARLRLGEAVAQAFPRTQPSWYGLWMPSPLSQRQQQLVLELLSVIAVAQAECRLAVRELRLGLLAAVEARLPLHVRLYPRGRVEGPWWRLVPHCPRCRAPWPTKESSPRPGRCTVCGYMGHPAPDKKRHACGLRPYFPLDRLLGPDEAARFLKRYQAFQKRQPQPDRPPIPPWPAPPGNPPAD